MSEATPTAAAPEAEAASAEAEPTVAEPAPTLDSGNTAWMLTSMVLVLFMTIPGLALFYAGMVRTKNVLSVMMQCFAITSLVTILWVVYGYRIVTSERSEEHTSELQSLMRISYAVFCLKKKKTR